MTEATQALLPVTPERDLAQFFFEMGFGACYAEAIVRNGNTVPFPLTDAEIERQWAISREAYDDADELEAMLSLARSQSHSLPGDAREADIALLGARMVLEGKATNATGALAKSDWRPSRAHIEGMRNTMREAIEYIDEARAALTPSALSGDAGERE